MSKSDKWRICTDLDLTDGFTVIHRFQLISDGHGCRVLYNSRRQVDELVESIRRTGRLETISFGQKRDPCVSFFQKLKCVFQPTRTLDAYKSNVGVTITTNLSGMQSRSENPSEDSDSTSTEAIKPNFVVVRTDTSQLKIIDKETLEPIGVTDQRKLHPGLIGDLSCAHAQYDPENGDVFNYNLAFGVCSTYRIFKTSRSTGETEILATITNLPAAYIHSFFLTKDFVILCVWSSHFAAGGVKLLWERNVVDAIGSFNPNSQAKWMVVDRRHGKGLVATFESPAMFSFHSVNAWQEPRQSSSEVDIVCDIIQYPSLDVLKKLYYENLVSTGSGVAQWKGMASRPSSTPSLARYHLRNVPLPSAEQQTAPPGTIAKAELQFSASAPLVGDLPTINPHYATKRSRYIYSLVDQGRSSWVDGISKFDTSTKGVAVWSRADHTPGEAIFVPDSTRVGEDAGYLLSVVLDGRKGTSYLLCLDAETMEEVGSAECDVAVGFGFHGNHVPS